MTEEQLEKKKERDKKWREANRDHLLRYRAENAERDRKKRLEHYALNKEKKRLQAKEWRDKNKDHVKERNRLYRLNHPEYVEKCRKADAEWRAKNPNWQREYDKNRSAKKLEYKRLKYAEEESYRQKSRDRNRRWYEANREEALEKSKQYRANPVIKERYKARDKERNSDPAVIERRRKTNRLWRINNVEWIRQYQERKSQDPDYMDRRREACRQWHIKNREYAIARCREYCKEHAEQLREHAQEYNRRRSIQIYAAVSFLRSLGVTVGSSREDRIAAFEYVRQAGLLPDDED